MDAILRLSDRVAPKRNRKEKREKHAKDRFDAFVEHIQESCSQATDKIVSFPRPILRVDAVLLMFLQHEHEHFRSLGAAEIDLSLIVSLAAEYKGWPESYRESLQQGCKEWLVSYEKHVETVRLNKGPPGQKRPYKRPSPNPADRLKRMPEYKVILNDQREDIDEVSAVNVMHEADAKVLAEAAGPLFDGVELGLAIALLWWAGVRPVIL